ncbi:hypothetical protein CMUS01_09961 [Colletotrichum musicola]|uniref:Uncharacterized protein n=1 Tax=Colletotrichum musicola TaxID=2175873 RepID=A0A8H6K4V3_9PEZI|nr:hypothetical protein CMUS01_09961 [Colletotrichum musicola]
MQFMLRVLASLGEKKPAVAVKVEHAPATPGSRLATDWYTTYSLSEWSRAHSVLLSSKSGRSRDAWKIPLSAWRERASDDANGLADPRAQPLNLKPPPLDVLGLPVVREPHTTAYATPTLELLHICTENPKRGAPS